MTAGVALVTRTVERIAAGDIAPVEQQYADEATLRPAPKIFKEDCRIDWTLPGRRIVDFIRGLAPYPTAWSDLIREEGDRKDGTAPGGESGGTAGNGPSVKIFSAAFEAAAHGLRPGTVASDGRTEIRIACADGWIIPGELQLAGKKRLPVRELLLGWRDATNTASEDSPSAWLEHAPDTAHLPLRAAGGICSGNDLTHPGTPLPIFRLTSSWATASVQKTSRKDVTPRVAAVVALHRHDHVVARPPASAGAAIRKASMVCNPISTRSICRNCAPQRQRIADQRPAKTPLSGR